MFQKEVALRILADNNDKQYGRLSVICNWLCDTQLNMTLSASLFTPAPKVDSCLITLKPKNINYKKYNR